MLLLRCVLKPAHARHSRLRFCIGVDTGQGWALLLGAADRRPRQLQREFERHPQSSQRSHGFGRLLAIVPPAPSPRERCENGLAPIFLLHLRCFGSLRSEALDEIALLCKRALVCLADLDVDIE